METHITKHIIIVSLRNMESSTSEQGEDTILKEVISGTSIDGGISESIIAVPKQVGAILNYSTTADTVLHPETARSLGSLSNTEEVYALILEETQQILQKINLQGIDFLEREIAGKKITQSELNALVFEYSSSHALDPKKLDIFFKDVFEIDGYSGEQGKMYTDAIRFTNEFKMQSLLQNIENISAIEILKHITTLGIEGGENLIKAFLNRSPKENLSAFFKGLETNDPIRNSLLKGNLAGDFIRKLGENSGMQNKLVASIIGDETILKTLSSDTLSSLDTILQKNIQDGSITGGLATTLKANLGLARNANNPVNITSHNLSNGNEYIRERIAIKNTPERRAWKAKFEELRTHENGSIARLDMIKRGNMTFFDNEDLDTFFNISFSDLEEGMRKNFLKEYVIPNEGQYHPVLEQFPRFRKTLEDEGLL